MGAKAIITLGFLLILTGLVGIFDADLISSRHVERGLGPQRVQHQETRSIPISPLLGVLVLFGGIALITIGANES